MNLRYIEQKLFFLPHNRYVQSGYSPSDLQKLGQHSFCSYIVGSVSK